MDMFQATEATDWALKSYEQQLALAERDRLPRDWGRSAKPRNSKKREFDLRLQLAAAMAMLLVAMLAAVSI